MAINRHRMARRPTSHLWGEGAVVSTCMPTHQPPVRFRLRPSWAGSYLIRTKFLKDGEPLALAARPSAGLRTVPSREYDIKLSG